MRKIVQAALLKQLDEEGYSSYGFDKTTGLLKIDGEIDVFALADEIDRQVDWV